MSDQGEPIYDISHPGGARRTDHRNAAKDALFYSVICTMNGGNTNGKNARHVRLALEEARRHIDAILADLSPTSEPERTRGER